jgi:hypothetical protein
VNIATDWFYMYIARLAGTIGICASLGCSGGSVGELASAAAPQPGINVTSMDAQSKDGLLFVSDYASNDVRIYRRGSEDFLRKITSLTQPQGLAVDSSRNLYVSTDDHDGSIEVFAPPCTTVALTIDGFGLKPSVVTVSNAGLVVGLDSGGMHLYPKGSHQLCTRTGRRITAGFPERRSMGAAIFISMVPTHRANPQSRCGRQSHAGNYRVT